MKKITLLIALFISVIAFGQTTSVPDQNFEAYLEANGMGNGITNDHLVTTNNISSIDALYVHSNNIADLTGIEDFAALTFLNCSENQLTSLDLSSNANLEGLKCYTNQLTSLLIGSNANLLMLSFQENQLISMDISSLPNLESLYCNDNQLSTLDASSNTNLEDLYCENNQLKYLNLANGNNNNMHRMYSYGNSSLICIQIDDDANTPPPGQDWKKDATANYSENCGVTPSVPLNNWTIALGIMLIGGFTIIRYRRNLA